MSSNYEAWVTAVRAWQENPATDMSGLPVLDASSLPPTAYERLAGHIMAAHVRVSADAWARFERAWTLADSEHDMTRALVQLRSLLGRRLIFARNPCLPTEIQDALWQGAARDIRSSQQELEDAVMRESSGGSSGRHQRERTLHMLRTNSLTAILAPGFPLESLYAAPLPPSSESSPVASITMRAPVSRRRVILDEN